MGDIYINRIAKNAPIPLRKGQRIQNTSKRLLLNFLQCCKVLLEKETLKQYRINKEIRKREQAEGPLDSQEVIERLGML